MKDVIFVTYPISIVIKTKTKRKTLQPCQLWRSLFLSRRFIELGNKMYPKTLHLKDKHGATRRTKTDKKDYKKAKKKIINFIARSVYEKCKASRNWDNKLCNIDPWNADGIQKFVNYLFIESYEYDMCFVPSIQVERIQYN